MGTALPTSFRSLSSTCAVSASDALTPVMTIKPLDATADTSDDCSTFSDGFLESG
jgi:hypothetical protein